jgi:hypothetical protein
MDLDPYSLLGVEIDASPREIDRARIYAKRILGEIAPSIGPEQAMAKGAVIDRAWETLRDPDRRAAVDRAIAQFPSLGQLGTGRGAGGTRGSQGRICSVCSATPAVTMHFRQRMSRKRIDSISDVYCRTCGIATFRDATNRTLLQGFWRARSLITTIAIVNGNLSERRRIGHLGVSEDAMLSTDSGRPLFLRGGVAAVVISSLLVVSTLFQLVEMSSVLTNHNPVTEKISGRLANR